MFWSAKSLLHPPILTMSCREPPEGREEKGRRWRGEQNREGWSRYGVKSGRIGNVGQSD
jgi:hypothetical protein